MNNNLQRYRIGILGESGSGLLSTGEILTKALKNLGFYLVADREYMSLIQGGHSAYILNISKEPIWSLSESVDLMLALDKQSLEALDSKLIDNGLLLHGYEKPKGLRQILERLEARGVKEFALPSREMAYANGGTVLMTNMVLIGALWKLLGLPYQVIADEVTERFKSKPKLLEIDLLCLQAGFDAVEKQVELELPTEIQDSIVLNGNLSLALGAVHAGCRVYYAYPMSPSSSILTYMMEMAPKTGMLVKQVEDEISVVQMAIGSMYAGTRALAATSGGGFDLMTESVSLAGIIENPLVVINAQRPGPGTGLPTWTAQGDLNLAMYAGHGEFARMVIAVSEVEDCFELIQHAFNYAEKYQMPVVVLTEKVIAESLWSIKPFEQNTVPIERGLVTDSKELAGLLQADRYKITESGVSKRWLPGSSDTYYFANGDEHLEDGSLTEDAEPAAAMYAKRNRKLDAVLAELPEPKLYGTETDADIAFVGWGSTKNAMLDAIKLAADQGKKIAYLHYSFVYPLRPSD